MTADMVGYSRLMERDEYGILSRQKSYRRDLIDPEIARNRGHIVKTTGDGMLTEFNSAQDAVRCSIDIQRAMAEKEEQRPPDERILYRVGVNLGDIIHDDDDIFGDGVNVAARIQTLAEPGGICVSDSVLQAMGDRISEDFQDMGSQRVKNISRRIRVWQWTPQQRERHDPPKLADQQTVRFCRSADGTTIAWTALGTGPAVLKAPHWMTHLEYMWNNPIWAPEVQAWSERVNFIRFDQRGNGLSDRDPDCITVEAMCEDMLAVADAAGQDRFAILAASQGAAFAVEFALAHRDRVSCIVFNGGYLRGRLMRGSAEETLLYETASNMIRQGWGSPNPLFRSFFASSFIPGATPAQQASFDEAQRVATDAQAALKLFEMNARVDALDAARQLDLPVLVLQARGDRVAPLKEGQLIARTIPGAQFVELPGDNHIQLEGTPGFDRMIEEATRFINTHT